METKSYMTREPVLNTVTSATRRESQSTETQGTWALALVEHCPIWI